MRKIVLEKDYGKKETFEKWNGKFLDDSSYDKVYKVTQKEDLGIMKPVRSLDCLLYTSPSPRDCQ